ncbi:sensor domain-containing protein [Aquipuribacter sp. MA13-6]|uniref:sensor domain-containing protein n=1 Tax=unclassified Aquipuribacter TaxID=2635084 RepID=UPI003EEF319E
MRDPSTPHCDPGGGASAPTSAWLREHFRAAFERSPVPQATVDRLGRLNLVNDALWHLLGRSRQELVGLQSEALGHGDDSGEGAVVLASLLRGQTETGRCERVLRHRDGSAVPVGIDVSVLHDESGAVDGAVAQFQDLRAVRAAERARLRQDEMTDAFARLASDLAIVSDADGMLLYVSPAVTRLFGYDSQDLVAGCGWDVVHPDDLAAAQDTYHSVVSTGVSATMLLRVGTRDGEWRWVEETCHNVLDSGIGGIVCNLTVVTERILAEQALRRSEHRYRTLAETAEEGIWAVDAQGRTGFANARVADILGVSIEEIYERNALDLLQPQDSGQMALRLATRHERGSERYEVAYRHPDGRTRQLWISAAPWTDEAVGRGSLALVSDITDARRAEAQIAAATLQDHLTGLANRALLLDRLEQATRRTELSPVVLSVDLDHFKLINDSRGHAVGDAVLVAVADRLRGVIGPHDTLARPGGDEFVIVMEHGDEADGKRLAKDVLDVLGLPVEIAEGMTVDVAASVGVAVSPGAGADDLLRFAEIAMYAAKTAGRGRARVFDHALADDAGHRFALAGDLRAALAAEVLEPHFQSVVELATGRVLGVEALARWTDPRRGPVRPDQFVPVAEASGLSGELDRYMLARALTQVGRLRCAGLFPPDAFVAVNLSAGNLQNSQFETFAQQWADRAGVPPRCVTLEITETAIMDEPEHAIAVLRRLREAGFGIAIDDFGTGYSSLAYLRDLPVSALKIDRSFISDLTTHPDAPAIAASIIELGKAVGVSVVAEGVETVAQASLLRRLGCATAQGWLWSKALPIEELAASGILIRPFDVRIPDDDLRGDRPTTAPAAAIAQSTASARSGRMTEQSHS